MTLEAIMTEIRDELKRSNDLKEKQLQDFTDTAENPAGWTQLPTEEAAEDVEEKKQPKKAPAKKAPAKRKPEQPADTEGVEKDATEQQEEPAETTPTEAAMKKAVAKIIKGTDNEKKSKIKTKISELGAKRVSDIKPEQRQEVINFIEELENE